MSKACSQCGSNQVAKGHLQSAGEVAFQPDDTKFFTAQTSSVPLQAVLCIDCGHIALYGETQKAEKITK